MAAYMIVFAEIYDRPGFIERYAAKAASLMAEYGGEYVLRGPGVEVLEGGFGAGASAVISKWPSKSAIRKFWDSEAYAALKRAREPLANCHVMMVEEPDA